MTLDITNLTKTFRGTRALDSLTFSLKQGEIFGFVGSNGAGKTTTMRIILGVLAPDSGTVTWEGKPIGIAQRRRIGYMPEERGLYPKMKVGDQLKYLACLHGLSDQEAKKASKRWTDRLGLSARIADEVQTLSLGNQQRVQLAAALVHEPDLLVLDEPFSGLDPVAVDVMSAVLHERASAGVPVMFSSHQLDLVERVCDRVGILSQGSLVSIGTIDQLRDQVKRRYAVGADCEVLSQAGTWISQIPGTTLIQEAPDQVVIEFEDPDLDEQQLLHTALRSGPIREFTLVRPSLSDIFRGVVSSDPGNENLRAKDIT